MARWNARRRYLEAGADAIFPEALQSAGRVPRFRAGSESAVAREHDGVRQKPAARHSRSLRDLGYRMVIFPQSAFRVSMKASEEFLRDLKKRGTQSGWIEQMQTRQGALRIARLRSGGGKLDRWM